MDKADLITIEQLSKFMEKMAGEPKEDWGKRQPGERCMYELKREGDREPGMGS